MTNTHNDPPTPRRRARKPLTLRSRPVLKALLQERSDEAVILLRRIFREFSAHKRRSLLAMAEAAQGVRPSKLRLLQPGPLGIGPNSLDDLQTQSIGERLWYASGCRNVSFAVDQLLRSEDPPDALMEALEAQFCNETGRQIDPSDDTFLDDPPKPRPRNAAAVEAKIEALGQRYAAQKDHTKAIRIRDQLEGLLHKRARWADQGEEFDPTLTVSPSCDTREPLEFWIVNAPAHAALEHGGELIIDLDDLGQVWLRYASGQSVVMDGWVVPGLRYYFEQGYYHLIDEWVAGAYFR